MSKRTSEQAFESYVEQILLNQSGWTKGEVSDWDSNRAIIPNDTFGFIEDTQPKLWSQMSRLHGEELHAKLLEALCKELDLKGTLHVLRQGFKFYGKTFKMAWFRPAHGHNPEVEQLYAGNRLTVMRQVPCHPGSKDTVDLLFAVNGLPVATCELKNPNTGQNWQHAIRQYKKDRDPNAPLFRFTKRALVHFAADPDQVHMATKLEKEKTVFLPFNRGSQPGEIKCGKGNPPNPDGYRTAYLWEDVLARDSLLDILGGFMFLEHKEKKVDDGKGGRKTVKKKTLIFPRYHQLDSVRKLVRASRNEGAGNNYLIQHSAGSGKTNSISWLAHHLASLHDADDHKVYDCVVVISDRQVIDRQLQDAIYQIEHAQGVVKPIDEDSKQLANALVDGTKVVVTTLQKFPFVLRALLMSLSEGKFESLSDEEKKKVQDDADAYRAKIADRRYAVVVDEAHSSQTGETARELKEILGAGVDHEDGEDIDMEDRLNQIMESRGRQKNLSFYAFTATPKGKTLELFGRPGPSGKPEAFHVYSMRQAIEENFIKDVLHNYTTYKAYYKLVKSAEDDPEMPKKKATRSLARFLSLHPYNIRQKTEIMVEHFRQHIKPKLGGKAKAMVVAGSRLHAVRYMNAFNKYLKDRGYTDIHPLVAFSGTVRDPDASMEYTEPGMNTDVRTGDSIPEARLPERFDSDDYQVLLVANKYQTGFDQPKLLAMYVDKRLEGVQAVQTLSRLNRNYPGKEEPFVLDFVNEREDIYASFKPYFDATSLEEVSDPQQLEEIKHEMDQMQVYHWPEVDAFAEIFYKPVSKHQRKDHARMEQQLQPAVDRFKELEEEQQQLFRDKLRGYVNIYSFLSQIMPWSDSDHEKLYSFGRFLLPHLPTGREEHIISPEDDVALRYYRLEQVATDPINLDEGDDVEVKSPTDVGSGKATDEQAPLSSIIEVLNERFGTDFTEEDRLFFEQVTEHASQNEQVIQTAKANSLDKFKLGIKDMVDNMMIERMAKNDDIVTRYMDDKEFKQVALSHLAREIFDRVLEREVDR